MAKYTEEAFGIKSKDGAINFWEGESIPSVVNIQNFIVKKTVNHLCT